MRLKEIDGYKGDFAKAFYLGRMLSQVIAKLLIDGDIAVLVGEGFQGKGFKFPGRLYPKNAIGIHTERFVQKYEKVKGSWGSRIETGERTLTDHEFFRPYPFLLPHLYHIDPRNQGIDK